jgi:hypothetical protein
LAGTSKSGLLDPLRFALESTGADERTTLPSEAKNAKIAEYFACSVRLQVW